LGTDALNPYQIPGYSAHEELVYLVQAGLTPYEALRAGTHDAALALGQLEEFGTVAEGKRADLLLLDGDPLEDVANSTRIAGVMLRGRWLARSELKAIMGGLKDSFRPTLLERLWPLVLLALVALIALRMRP
jgi:imidazolonepropionase-like amidohydrolase